MLRVIRDDRDSFRFLIEAALRTWDETELSYLAETLVHFFLCDPESKSPYDPLLERLSDIIDIDIKLWKEFGCVEDIENTSFSAKLLTQIVQLPEARHYIHKTFSKFYDEIDYEYLDNINFEELSRAFGKTDTSYFEPTRKRVGDTTKINWLDKIEEEMDIFEEAEDSEQLENKRHEEMFGIISDSDSTRDKADSISRETIQRSNRLSDEVISEVISGISSPSEKFKNLNREKNPLTAERSLFKCYSVE